MRSIKTIRKGFLLAGMTVAITFVTSGCGISNYSSNGVSREKNYTSEGDVKSLKINSSNMDIILSTSADEQCHVTCYENDRYKFKIYEADDGTLHVKEQDVKKFTFFELPNNLHKITVEVPEGFDGTVDIDTDMSAVVCEDIQVGELAVKSENGKITMNDVAIAGELTVDGYRDVISIVDTKADGAVTLKNGWETTYFQNLEFGSELTLENSWGNITGYLEGPIADYSLTCVVEHGECNLPSSLPGGEKKVTIENSWGDVSVEFGE